MANPDPNPRQPQHPANGSKSMFFNFPMGTREGFSQWWASIPAATAEHRVLSFIPYLKHAPTQKQTGKDAAPASEPQNGDAPQTSSATAPDDTLTVRDSSEPAQVVTHPSSEDPYGPRQWESTMVKLSGNNRGLNEFCVQRVGEPVQNTLLILHGFGAGLGFFYKNFEPLSRRSGWQLYALDLLGMGRSTRPPFNVDGKKQHAGIALAEDWFIDAIEEWRKIRNIDRFTLIGHSLGGYLAAAYTLKYPGHLDKLILASPVGVPEHPVVSKTKSEGANTNTTPPESNPPSQPAAQLKTYHPIIKFLWDNVSAFSLIRWAGPFGPQLVSNWTARRFSHLPPAQYQALHDYSYAIFRQRGSGENALSYILSVGAHARSPLIRRIHLLSRRQAIPKTTFTEKESGSQSANDDSASPPTYAESYPTIFMYGSVDWMDVNGGREGSSIINNERKKTLDDPNVPADVKERDRGWSKVYVISNAGHHLYLDGWEEFNDRILEEMEEVEKATR